MIWLLSLFPGYRRVRDIADRVIAFQDRVAELEAQNTLLRSQVEKAQATETQSVKQLANIMSQLQFRTKLFEDVPGLPEPKITEEDLRPIQNQHSYIYAMDNARRESERDFERWQKLYVQRVEEERQRREQAQQPEANRAKSLEELAAEVPAFQ